MNPLAGLAAIAAALLLGKLRSRHGSLGAESEDEEDLDFLQMDVSRHFIEQATDEDVSEVLDSAEFHTESAEEMTSALADNLASGDPALIEESLRLAPYFEFDDIAASSFLLGAAMMRVEDVESMNRLRILHARNSRTRDSIAKTMAAVAGCVKGATEEGVCEFIRDNPKVKLKIVN